MSTFQYQDNEEIGKEEADQLPEDEQILVNDESNRTDVAILGTRGSVNETIPSTTTTEYLAPLQPAQTSHYSHSEQFSPSNSTLEPVDELPPPAYSPALTQETQHETSTNYEPINTNDEMIHAEDDTNKITIKNPEVVTIDQHQHEQQQQQLQQPTAETGSKGIVSDESKQLNVSEQSTGLLKDVQTTDDALGWHHTIQSTTTTTTTIPHLDTPAPVLLDDDVTKIYSISRTPVALNLQTLLEKINQASAEIDRQAKVQQDRVSREALEKRNQVLLESSQRQEDVAIAFRQRTLELEQLFNQRREALLTALDANKKQRMKELEGEYQQLEQIIDDEANQSVQLVTSKAKQMKLDIVSEANMKHKQIAEQVVSQSTTVLSSFPVALSSRSLSRELGMSELTPQPNLTPTSATTASSSVASTTPGSTKSVEGHTLFSFVPAKTPSPIPIEQLEKSDKLHTDVNEKGEYQNEPRSGQTNLQSSPNSRTEIA